MAQCPMATPYHSTPRIPGPPNPTPLSVTAYTLPNSRARRPPIHNPYDKFTQPEFDAWIGDITGALRRALGQIEADDESKLFECTQEVSTGNAKTGFRPIDLDESEDEAVNDSFAEIKARRALGKGKARDPREGPGLGGTDRSKPIEIVSSDEEEEHEVELAIGAEDDDSEEEEEEEEEDNYSEQEEDYSWKRGQSSSQQMFSPAKRRKYTQEEEGPEGDESEEGSEEDGEEDPTTRNFQPTEIIDIVSDDENEMGDDGQDRGLREEEEWSTEELEERSEGTGEEYSEEEEQVRLGTSHLNFHAARVRNSQDSRDFHHVDEDGTKDESQMVEDDEEIEEIQPPTANTAFPSQARRSPAPVDHRIESPDPWADPRACAKDNYTGDGVRRSPGTRDPRHLGDDDNYEIEEVMPDVTDNKLDGDEMQNAEDTSFPPHDEQRPVDIPDPWVGLRTYAEDFYAGGDVRTHPGQEIDPSLLEGTVPDDIGVPSASKIVIPEEQGYEEDAIEGGEQLEDELEYGEEAVIQLPTQHTFSPTSRLARRAFPMPANIEFISIDDSDEEISSEDQEPIKLGPLKVVEVEFQELQHENIDEQNMEREQSLEVDEIDKEDTAHIHQPSPPLDPTPPNETEADISSSSIQQDGISMDQCESLYANMEATVQTEDQADVIATLVDWNYPPAFPDGISTSAPGHLATPSPEESNADVGESVIQALDNEVDSPDLVNKESSPRPLVHDEVITQAEKDLDKAIVENAETHGDVTLPIPGPVLVEDSKPQLTSQTLIVDPSLSHAFSSDLVNDTPIDKHNEGIVPEKAAQGHKFDVEITPEDVTELVDEGSANESAPAQKNSENIVDDDVESRDIDISMQETKSHTDGLPISVVLNFNVAAPNVEDDIPPSAEGINEHMDTQAQPFTSTSSVQIPVPVYHPHHSYDYDQLPTPPPDQSPTVQSPSVANDNSSLTSPPRRHKVEVEEIQDEDDVRPQPFWTDSAVLDLQIDLEPAAEPGYSVVEPGPDDEYADEDADGEIDFDVEIVSMSSGSHMGDEVQSKGGEIQLPLHYIVEEPLTDGRLTEEPGDRAQSLGVVSVETEESEAQRTDCETATILDVPLPIVEEPVPLDSEASLQAETIIQPQTSSNPSLEKSTDYIGPPTSATHVIPDSLPSAVERDAPIPVTANANVVDPTICPDTPSHLSAGFIPAALDVQTEAQRQAQGDGLFTPANESTVTPARLPENLYHPLLDELAHAFFGTPIVSSTPMEEFVPMSNRDLLSDIDLVIDQDKKNGVPETVQLPLIGAEATHISGAHASSDIQAPSSCDDPISMPTSPPPRDPPVSMHVTLTRKPTHPILVSDPYPYSLSTPGVSLMDPTEEDTEQDNSMSSNSTLEKDLEDKDTNSILDDIDELELQYPPELDVLAELDVPAAVRGEEASKIADEVVDVDADGDFDPEFVVTHLPQPSVNSQLVDPSTLTSTANLASTYSNQGRLNATELITSDSTIAPDPFKGGEKTDGSPRGILPIDPVKELSSSDFPPSETANHDLPEASTTPPNKIAGTSAPARGSKRKRDPTLDNVAAATTEKAEKGKNKKVSKLAGKGKAKATNQEVVDPLTRDATIHVKPRRKTQSVESVASRALSKKPSESRSSSGASATYRMLRSSSRSSSVASSIPSDQSVGVVVQPSPTIHKPNLPTVQASLQPISLFHAHGMKRNNQNNQPQSSQARTHPTQPPRTSTVQRVISLPRTNDSGSTAAASPTTATSPAAATSPTAAISPTAATSPSPAPLPANMKAVPSPTVRNAPAISSSSLVTRSHCRYHRISLPKEEGGPRVCFLVPGCSLNDRALMAAEEIEDHGDATHDDSLRMIKDIQSLDFDSYLIGILRQLVGLDILREQEVFYLPQPGEEVVRKTSPRKERSGFFRGADSSSYTGSPGYSSSIRSPASMKAPASVADSTSTSLSALRRRLDSEKGSVSALSDTEPSDEELPDAKRARPSPPDEQGGAGPMGPPLRAQGKRPLKGRRSKQTDVEYQPEQEHEDDSDDAQSSNRRKKPSKQGVKRRRGSEITVKNDGNERVLKKVKTRMSVSMSELKTT